MRTFENEWLIEPFDAHPSFATRPMFGGLAVYLFGRMMLLLVEPTKNGRWKWHGVLVCTDYAHHAAIIAEFPALAPHDVLEKWLYLDSHHPDFLTTKESVAEAIAQDDPRFGILPRVRKRTARLSRPSASF